MACAICRARRSRRFCPGVNGEICSICCGTEREVTVACPLDCPHLRDAREHEKPGPEPEEIPNPDIRVTDKLLEENQELLAFLSESLVAAAVQVSGAVDFDVRGALDALIRTYRTRQSGLYYDSLPENAIAANIYRLVEEGLQRFREEETKGVGVSRTRDSAVLALLVFLHRLEGSRNNGRRRGRAFIHFLRGASSPSAGVSGQESSPLLLP